MANTPPPLPYLDVIDSFGIRRTQQFFIIGQLHGTAEPGMFANIALGGLLLPVRITVIEEVEFPADNQTYTLVEMREEESGTDFLDLLLALKVGLEVVTISEKGTN